MMAKENGSAVLINRILSDADSEAERIISDAAAKAVAIGTKAEAEAKRLTEEGDRSAKTTEEAVLDRVRTNAALESKKYLLAKKRELISKAFDEAEARFAALSAERRTDFYSALILRECEGGETLCPSTAEKELFAALLSGVNGELKKRGCAELLLGEGVSIGGGFLLKSRGYEKNCSVDAVFAQLREDEQLGVASLLFGEGK